MGERQQNSRVSFCALLGTRTVPWADSSGRTKEKETLCGRAEPLFYFCVLHFVAVSELHEQMFL